MGKKIRNPFVFFLLREMYRWEVMDTYDEISKFTLSHYFLLNKPVPLDYVAPIIEDIDKNEKANVIERAQSFRRSILDPANSVEFTDDKLNQLARSISKLGRWYTYDDFEKAWGKHPYAIWCSNYLLEKEQAFNAESTANKFEFKDLSVSDREEINSKVQIALHHRVAFLTMTGYLDTGFFDSDVIVVSKTTAIARKTLSDISTITKYLSTYINEEKLLKLRSIVRMHTVSCWAVINDVKQISGIFIITSITEDFYSRLIDGSKTIFDLTFSDTEPDNISHILWDLIYYSNPNAKQIMLKKIRVALVKAFGVWGSIGNPIFCAYYNPNTKFLLNLGFRPYEDMLNKNNLCSVKYSIFSKLHKNLYS